MLDFEKNMEFNAMKFFAYSCILLSCLSFLADVIFRFKGIENNAFWPFTMSCLLLGTGMEIVRKEFGKIQNQISEKP